MLPHCGGSSSSRRPSALDDELLLGPPGDSERAPPIRNPAEIPANLYNHGVLRLDDGKAQKRGAWQKTWCNSDKEGRIDGYCTTCHVMLSRLQSSRVKNHETNDLWPTHNLDSSSSGVQDFITVNLLTKIRVSLLLGWVLKRSLQSSSIRQNWSRQSRSHVHRGSAKMLLRSFIYKSSIYTVMLRSTC